MQKLRRQCGRETVGLRHEVELVIPEQARDVEVARPHASPIVIGDERFRVQHRSAEFEDAGAGMQQLAISAAREDANDRHVGGAGQEQPDVHAAAGRVDEGSIERRRSDEICVGYPEPLRDRGGEQLHGAVDA